jgi:dethiobiotin synthetase
LRPVIVTGTDTGVGKTVFAAGLTAALGASYWKPVQSGLDEVTDSETVAKLSNRPVLPEAYRLTLPASPLLAAEAEGIEIDLDRLALPKIGGLLVVEGAGGVMVPLTPNTTFLDLYARWQTPVILVARTTLGTINHSLLSLSALKHAGCTVLGVAFCGAPEREVEKTICDMGQTAHLGRLPILAPLTPENLTQSFSAIDLASVRRAL